MKAKAAVTWGAGQGYRMEEVEVGKPKAGEVLLEVLATGVCATDAGAEAGYMGVPFPIILGHEAVGIVVEVGEGVSSVAAGDAVVVACCKCGNCDPCLTGAPGSCEHIPEINFGGYMQDGTVRVKKDDKEIHTFFGQSSFATYAVANEKNLVKVDKNDPDLLLYGPLGCGFVTGAGTILTGLKPEAGSTIAIFGLGGVGLSAVMAAKIVGCTKIIAVDINEERIALAKEVGATHAFNAQNVDTVSVIRSLTDNMGVHYAVECTGNAEVARNALSSLRIAGEVAIIGAGYQPIPIDLTTEFLFGRKKMSGYIAGNGSAQYIVPKLIEYHNMGMFPIEKIVKYYDFADIDQAFSDSREGKTVKSVLKIKGSSVAV